MYFLSKIPRFDIHNGLLEDISANNKIGVITFSMTFTFTKHSVNVWSTHVDLQVDLVNFKVYRK